MHATCNTIRLYPIKGAAGVELPEAQLTHRGLAMSHAGRLIHDRSFAVWNPGTELIRSQDQAVRDTLTQREVMRLALLESKFSGDTLVLSVRDARVEPITVSLEEVNDAHAVQAKVWGSVTPALDFGDRVGAWLRAALVEENRGGELRLISFDDTKLRPKKSAFAFSQSDVPRFADGFPFHTISTNALDELNRRISGAVAKDTAGLLNGASFRANLELTYPEGVSDDDVARMNLSEGAALEHVKPCNRCIGITVEQESAQRYGGGEPMKTLWRYRQIQLRDHPNAPWSEGDAAFGWNAELRQAKFSQNLRIAAGDLLSIEMRQTQDPRWRWVPER